MPKTRKLIVHLGNVDGGLTKTHTLAVANPLVDVIGIDLRRISRSELPDPVRPPNWIQWNCDFFSGLGRFRDASIAEIDSDFALGYYANGGGDLRNCPVSDVLAYSREIIRIAHLKLVSGGILRIAFFGADKDDFLGLFAGSPFIADSSNVQQIPEDRARDTFYTIYGKHLGNFRVMELVARKALKDAVSP